MPKHEIIDKTKCPCGSGKKYIKCCKVRNIKWLVDNDGNFYKQIPIPEEAQEILYESENHFIKIFNRSPKPTDRVLLAGYLVSEEELRNSTLQAMHSAGLGPELIYAYKKPDY